MALTRKLFYISIFTSKNFRTQTRKERERKKRSLVLSLTSSSTLSVMPNVADPLLHTPQKISTLLRKFLSSLTLIIHAKTKPKDRESYRRWSPNPVPNPRPCRSNRAAQTHYRSNHATSTPPSCSNPSPMNPIWLCSPSPPPSISSLDRTQSPLSLPSSLNLTEFDDFFLGFVSFVFLCLEMILYICFEAEKMWATNRKCVFYCIFKNITKH